MYCKEVTRAYLEKLGITDITADGKHVFKGSEELAQQRLNSGYYAIGCYDKDLYDAVYPLTKSKSAGTVVIPVHRAVYAWHRKTASANLVVDHINDDKADNRLENLRLITPGDNIWKGRIHGVKRIKCQIDKPLSFYVDKLDGYEYSYEKAKTDKDQKKAHKCRANISNCKARIRYWLDAHLDDIAKECKKKGMSYEEAQEHISDLYAGNGRTWSDVLEKGFRPDVSVEEGKKLMREFFDGKRREAALDK